MGELSPIHWLIVLAIILLLFGGRKIPELARGLGEGIPASKKGCLADHTRRRLLHSKPLLRRKSPRKKRKRNALRRYGSSLNWAAAGLPFLFLLPTTRVLSHETGDEEYRRSRGVSKEYRNVVLIVTNLPFGAVVCTATLLPQLGITWCPRNLNRLEVETRRERNET
jgi:TatA/E family protein of Tat protein translocase